MFDFKTRLNESFRRVVMGTKEQPSEIGLTVNIAIYTVLTNGAERVLKHLRDRGVPEEKIKDLIGKADKFIEEMFDDG